MYPNPKKPSEKLPSAKFTKTFYCIKSTCVTSRFPYFDSSYLEIPTKVKEALKDAYMKLLQVELGHNAIMKNNVVCLSLVLEMALSALSRIPPLNIKKFK